MAADGKCGARMGKLALVTGASSGIGLELARQFVEHGFDVILNAEDDELAQAEASLAGSGAEVRRSRPTWRPLRGWSGCGRR